MLKKDPMRSLRLKTCLHYRTSWLRDLLHPGRHIIRGQTLSGLIPTEGKVVYRRCVVDQNTQFFTNRPTQLAIIEHSKIYFDEASKPLFNASYDDVTWIVRYCHIEHTRIRSDISANPPPYVNFREPTP